MTITKTEEFAEANRYHYDWSLTKDFAQLDTDQDASYYGNWASPKRRIIFSYVEGDCITVKCETDEEFKAEVLKLIEWHNKNGKFIGIDVGLSKRKKPWIKLGLSDHLH